MKQFLHNIPGFIRSHRIISISTAVVIIIGVVTGTIFATGTVNMPQPAQKPAADVINEEYKDALQGFEGLQSVSANTPATGDTNSAEVTIVVDSFSSGLLSRLRDAIGSKNEKYEVSITILGNNNSQTATFTEGHLFEATLLDETFDHYFADTLTPSTFTFIVDPMKDGNDVDSYQISALFDTDSFAASKESLPALIKWVSEKGYPSAAIGVVAGATSLLVSIPASSEQSDSGVKMLEYFSTIVTPLSTVKEGVTVYGSGSLDGQVYFGAYTTDGIVKDDPELFDKIKSIADNANTNVYTINFYN